MGLSDDGFLVELSGGPPDVSPSRVLLAPDEVDAVTRALRDAARTARRHQQESSFVPPEILGMDEGRAVSLLRSLKLDPLVTHAQESSTASESGKRVVTAADPPPATHVPKGSTVRITVR